MPSIASRSSIVQKLGVPFGDTAALVGAIAYLAPTASAEVRDLGYAWQVTAARARDQEDRQRLAQALDRLPNASAMRSIRRWVPQALSLDPEDLFKSREKVIIPQFIEPAMAKGTRGPDPLSAYSNLRSEGGVPFKVSIAQGLFVILGACMAARARAPEMKNGQRFILPTFKGNMALDATSLNLRDIDVWHRAGIGPATIWAGLTMMDRIPQAHEVAFSHLVPRMESYSGYVGLERLMASSSPNLAYHAYRYLRLSDGKLGVGADLARSLADFVVQPSVRNLEKVVHDKARAMVDKDSYLASIAGDLFSSRQAFDEVRRYLAWA